jgi:hypothetical protein
MAIIMNAVKTFLSRVLYYIGDLISKFLHFDCMSWLYPSYNKIMNLSLRLDKDGKVWQTIKKRKLHE